MKHTKIAIIGAGNVGATTAYTLMLQNLTSEIILVDINQKHCEGEILDLADVLAFSAATTMCSGTYKAAADADIIIITAGKNQKPGQSRQELARENAAIIKSIMHELQPINPQALMLVVTNPVDTMALQAYRYAKLPAHRIIGTGTLLDSKRLQGLVARTIGVSEESVELYTIGEHGDTQLPLWSSAQISGIPLTNWPEITDDVKDLLAAKARERASDIICLKGATYFGIAACTAHICQSILFDQKKVLPVSVYDSKKELYYSMPAVIGANGIEKVIEPAMTEDEQQKLQASCVELLTRRSQLS